jgi:3-oxoacyl-[acyl-carrier protein] reductase
MRVALDVTNQKSVNDALAAVIARFGRVDVLVNNAGVYEFQPLEAVTPEHFHRQFDVNVLGLLLATQEAAKHLREGGSVINIGSLAATTTPPSSSVYSATKAAVDAVTRVLSKELGPRRIRVNALNPGMIETEGTRTAGILESDFRRQVEAGTPLGRIGQPDDVARAAVFLASADSGWITGETILVAGGNR